MTQVWGQLPKSQIDPEKIEEAIDRIVEEHNDDPEAHLGEGQSLQSHKASEIIDHLAKSIIRDKIADREIIVDKLNLDKIRINPSLESTDGWWTVTQGSGGHVIPTVGTMELRCGDSLDNKTYATIRAGGYLETSYELNPAFEIKAIFVGAGGADFRLRCPGLDPFNDANDSFGFECLEADDVTHAYYIRTGTKYRQELSGVTPNMWHHYRAELIFSGSSIICTINYYVDDVLVHQYEDVWIAPGADTFFAFGVRQKTHSYEEGDMAVSDVVYSGKIRPD